MKKLLIEVSMIVKNEEAMLASCLESIKGADLITICDTGSTDKTIEIAKKYTDKVYTDFKWCDHFGKARQHSKDKCTGDWIMNIDADEILENPFDEVRDAIREADRIGANIVNVSTTACTGNATNRFSRIYKNLPNMEWHGAAHNYLVLKGEPLKAYESKIVHKYWTSPAHKLDPNRTLRILTQACKENPELSRERYYLAREHLYRKQYKKCITHVKKYLKVSDFKAERADAYYMMAKAYWYLQEGNKAREACLQAIGINPNFKEALHFMSEMYYEPAKTRWASFAELADNSNVLFVREKAEPKDFAVGDDMKLKPVK